MSTNTTHHLVIDEEPNHYHDKILDIIGNQFNFSHEKGLAEWLKNSVDAYRRKGTTDKDQLIVLRFNDETNSTPSSIECFDFVGMDVEDIDKAFKWWGDPNAARRGKDVKVFGGHGNGGKFYMRQMFKTSHFITYKKGKISIFGFNDSKKYGYAMDYKNTSIPLEKALSIAGIAIKDIPEEISEQLKQGKTGFTVVKGIQPKGISSRKLPISRICEKLKYHPQARSPLKYCDVKVVYNNKIVANVLRMEAIEPMEGFEGPYSFEIPSVLPLNNQGESDKKVPLSNSKYPQGTLELHTSSLPFGRGGKKPELNCIDMVGEIGVIASYNMQQIGLLQYYPQAQYIYGECRCPILENPDYDCVQNDRERLAENELSQALLGWICTKIDEIGEKIAKKEELKQEEKILKTTDQFNLILNSWKNQFMSKLFAEVLGGPNKGQSVGGFGGGDPGGSGSNDNNGKDNKPKDRGGEGEEKKTGPRAPLVLLSGQEDPDVPGLIVDFSERHFTVEQRQQDVSRGIYWINRKKPMAKKLIEKYGVESPQWRNYLFQRYIDIFMKETIYRLAKREGGTLTPEQVEQEIMRISSLVYDKATVDLEDYLLNDSFKLTT